LGFRFFEVGAFGFVGRAVTCADDASFLLLSLHGSRPNRGSSLWLRRRRRRLGGF